MSLHLSFWQTVSTNWSSQPPQLLKSFNLTQKNKFEFIQGISSPQARPIQVQWEPSISPQSLICLQIISLTSWDLGKQLPVEDYRADYRPPARLALIKNSFDEQECPSRCWLISKLDQPIDVKREEQQELENYSYPKEMFVTLTVTLSPSVALECHHGSGVWKLWIWSVWGKVLLHLLQKSALLNVQQADLH